MHRKKKTKKKQQSKEQLQLFIYREEHYLKHNHVKYSFTVSIAYYNSDHELLGSRMKSIDWDKGVPIAAPIPCFILSKLAMYSLHKYDFSIASVRNYLILALFLSQLKT